MYADVDSSEVNGFGRDEMENSDKKCCAGMAPVLPTPY